MPSLGDIVYYIPSRHETVESGQSAYAAIVTEIHDNAVSLCIFMPSGNTRARYRVPFKKSVDTGGDYAVGRIVK